MKRPFFYFESDNGGGGAAGGGGTLLAGAGGSGGGDPGAGGGGDPATAAGWVNPDGTFAQGWLEKLPQDLRANPSLTVLPSIEAMAKSYVETKGLVGKKLEVPGEGAAPEVVAAWRKTLGVPEAAEGYLGDAKTLRPEDFPEKLWDGEGEKKFLALAHKHNLTPAAVKDIIGFHAGGIKAQLEAGAAQEGEVLKAELGKLHQAWGKDFDGNLNLASRVAQTVGLAPDHAIFTNSDVVQAFAKLGKLFSEDKLVTGEARGMGGSITERIREISDPGSSHQLAKDYRGENGPERQQAAQTQLHDLYKAQSAKN